MFRIISAMIFFSLFSLELFSLDGFEIMKKNNQVEDGDDISAKMVMKIIEPEKNARVRKLTFARKDFGSNSRTLTKFIDPPDDKGTAFLNWNNSDRDNDQWLYLPSLNKVRRIASTDKFKSFMGSDFSYDDLGKRSLNKDSFKYIKEEKVNGIDCYVVESAAKDPKEKYPRRTNYIRKDNYLTLKIIFFNENNKEEKIFSSVKFEVIQKINTVTISKMEDLIKNRYTTIELSEIKYNTNLSDRLFREDSLK